MRQRFSEEEINLTIEQYFVLNILDNEEGLILQDLADLISRDKSAVLRHIDGLEQHHYVARCKDPEDKRRKILLVTKQGVKILKQAKKIAEQVNDEVSCHIPEKKLAEYKQNIDMMYEEAVSKLNS